MNTAVDRLRLVGYRQELRAGARARRRRHGGEAGHGAWAPRRERCRQVDAAAHPVRRLYEPSVGACGDRRRARCRSRTGRRPPRRDRDDPPGAAARPRAHRRAEHVPRPPAESRRRPSRRSRRSRSGRPPKPWRRSTRPSIRPHPIRTLKVAQRQIVEIARAMMEDAKVLAMDEPTSSLTPAEFERLAVLIAELAARASRSSMSRTRWTRCSASAETATILRDGRKVDDVVLKETTESGVVARMVGRELAHAEHKSFARDEIVARGVEEPHRAATAVREVSFQLRKGEVLGISGLVGAGRTELLRLIAGVDRPSGGRDPDRGQASTPRQPARRDRRRPRAVAGRAQARRDRRAPLGAQQHRACLHAPLLAASASSASGRSAAESQALMRDLNLRPARDRAADRPVQRRQPAEGHHRPLDRRRCAHPAVRRADPRHRRRRQGRDLRPDRAARRRGALDDRRLLRAAGDPARRPTASWSCARGGSPASLSATDLSEEAIVAPRRAAIVALTRPPHPQFRES